MVEGYNRCLKTLILKEQSMLDVMVDKLVEKDAEQSMILICGVPRRRRLKRCRSSTVHTTLLGVTIIVMKVW